MPETIAPPFWHPAVKGAFILDWDGVLADTKLDFSALRQRYFGGRIVPLIEAAENFPPPVREEIRDEVRRVEMEGADRAVPVPGAHEFIAWLRNCGKPWAVVSRNCRNSILLAAERCGIELPPVLLSREDPAVKPEPEALFLAAERLGVAPGDCVMVGDFIYDMLGARRAVVRCVLTGRGNVEWGSLPHALQLSGGSGGPLAPRTLGVPQPRCGAGRGPPSRSESAPVGPAGGGRAPPGPQAGTAGRGLSVRPEGFPAPNGGLGGLEPSAPPDRPSPSGGPAGGPDPALALRAGPDRNGPRTGGAVARHGSRPLGYRSGRLSARHIRPVGRCPSVMRERHEGI